jgi:hypothetical protein
VGIIETSCCIFPARPLSWGRYAPITVLFRIAAGDRMSTRINTRMSTRISTCSRCGTALACAMADGAAGPCWCMDLPPVVPVPDADGPAAAAGCWCRTCLEQHIAQSTAAAPATPRPTPARD